MHSANARPSPDAIDLGTLKIPIGDYASQGNAILGIRDSGKSYTATAIAEKLLTAGVPIVAFDPIGVWRFLRHAGRGPGFEVILVGDGGEMPIDEDSAEELMRHAMKTKASIIFDLYSIHLSKASWRRIVETCVRVLLYENKSHGLRHVFLEEAAEFVPQMLTREYAGVYAEIEKLVRMGGNAMLGITLINQRAEQVNKAVLELCACLVLHAQKGRLSLQALTKWLDFGDKSKTAGIIEKLPMLEQGECFVWPTNTPSPTFTKIPAKRTFHPNRREHTTPGKLTPGTELMRGYQPTAPAPKTKKAPIEVVGGPPAPEPEIVEKFVFREGELAKLELIRAQISELLREAQTFASDLAVLFKEADHSVKYAASISNRPAPQAPTKRPQVATTNGKTIGKGGRCILSVLAGRHPARLTFAQLGTLAGYTPSSMRTYITPIREAGFLDENAQDMTITQAGLDFIGGEFEKMPKSGEALLTFWCRKLTQGEANVLKCLANFRGRTVTMDVLVSQTGYTDSSLKTYLSPLRRNKLIDAKELRIMPEFL